jgi:adenine deaminase
VDDRRVDTILDMGAVDHEIRVAIEMGIDVMTAYQMATINNAQHWHCEADIGVIAPGRYADILLISNLETVAIERVISGGETVAIAGQMVRELNAPVPPGALLHSMHLRQRVQADDFRMAAPMDAGTVRVPAFLPGYQDPDIEPLLTDLPVVNGAVQRDPVHDVNKVAIVERHRGTGNISVGFWRIGFQSGAVAMSILHDNHNISVVGATDAEMALAVNRVADLGGGIVVVEDNTVRAEVPLPLGGLMSDAPVPEVAAQVRKVRDMVQTLGPSDTLGSDPLLRLTFMFLTCHPYTYTQTDQGLFETKTGNRLAVPL